MKKKLSKSQKLPGQISTQVFLFFLANAFVLQPLISGSQTHFASSDSRAFLLFLPSRYLAHVEQATLSKESQALPPLSFSLSTKQKNENLCVIDIKRQKHIYKIFMPYLYYCSMFYIPWQFVAHVPPQSTPVSP